MALTSPKADLELLFGVLGGGSVSGQSGTLIRGQLNELVGELNNAKNTNERKIRLSVDTQATTKEFRSKLVTTINDVNSTNKFKIKISEISADDAIKKLRDDINNALKMLKVDTGFDVKVNADGSKTAVKQIAQDAEEAIKKAEHLNATLAEIASSKNSVDKSYKAAKDILGGENAAGDNLGQYTAMRDKYIELNALFGEIKEKQKNGFVVSDDDISKLRGLTGETQRLTAAVIDRMTAEKEAAAAQKIADTAERSSIPLNDDIEAYNASLARTDKLLAEVKKGKENWSKAKSGISSDEYNKLSGYIEELEKLKKRLENGELSADDFAKSFNNISSRAKASIAAIKSAGENTTTLADRFKNLAEKFSTWLTVSQVVMFTVRQVKKMVTNVIELDDAMTELKKVTDETDSAYDNFFKNASRRAKELGVTLKDTINATASFARLGYNIADASALADAAVVYNNVGDEIESVDDASASIISTMQAFGVEAKNVMTIVDKFNEVGKSLPKSIVICWVNTLLVAISVKSQRWPRPRKDLVFVQILFIRNDCNTLCGNIQGFATPLLLLEGEDTV